MDPFALIMLGIVVALILFVLLLGRYHPKSGSDVLRWQPTRSAEVEVQNEVDDLDQMLEATNRRRRARGESELTEAALRDQVAEDTRLRQERRESYLEQEDIRQMLEITNQKRRRRGEPELTEAELRADVERNT
jgi:cell shape-determining protein MreC